MAQTDQLLDLMDSFPGAFKDEQPTRELGFAAASTVSSVADIEEALDPNLRQLISEFPSAFVDPATNESASNTSNLETETTELSTESSTTVEDPAVTAIVNTEAAAAVSFAPFQMSAQPGKYSQALKRQISTMTWGQVEFYLIYEEEGLQSIWVTVGKSGTEVQSLCEAIARLINLSLTKQILIPEIARQIRGIRGADSEGLGPNRFLGLADLIGKVLQEAPTELTPTRPENAPINQDSDTKNDTDNNSSTDLLPTPVWTELTDHDHEASVCPECGSELHQVNGCSGGACVVCGYSSCS